MPEPKKENDLRTARGMFAEMQARHPGAAWATEAQQQLERGTIMSILLTGKPIYPPTNQ